MVVAVMETEIVFVSLLLPYCLFILPNVSLLAYGRQMYCLRPAQGVLVLTEWVSVDLLDRRGLFCVDWVAWDLVGCRIRFGHTFGVCLVVQIWWHWAGGAAHWIGILVTIVGMGLAHLVFVWWHVWCGVWWRRFSGVW